MAVKDKLIAGGGWLRRHWLITLVLVAVLAAAGE